MKKLMNLLCIGSLCLFVACGTGTSDTDSVDSAEDINDSVLTDSNSMSGDTTSAISGGPVSEEDAEWAVEAANGGMTEVELGKVAQERLQPNVLKISAL